MGSLYIGLVDQKTYSSPNYTPCAYINISNPGIYLFVFNLRGTSPFSGPGRLNLVGTGVTASYFESTLDNCSGTHIGIATASTYTLNLTSGTNIISSSNSFFYAIRIA